MSSPPATAVVLVAHGSRSEAANEAHRELCAQVAAVTGLDVTPGFLELATPSIPDALDQAVATGATRVRVVPYFLHPGRHLAEDLPRLVDEASERHRQRASIELTGHVGGDERMVQLLADLARDQG